MVAEAIYFTARWASCGRIFGSVRFSGHGVLGVVPWSRDSSLHFWLLVIRLLGIWKNQTNLSPHVQVLLWRTPEFHWIPLGRPGASGHLALEGCPAGQETHQVSHFRRDLLASAGEAAGIVWLGMPSAAESHHRAAMPTATDVLRGHGSHWFPAEAGSDWKFRINSEQNCLNLQILHHQKGYQKKWLFQPYFNNGTSVLKWCRISQPATSLQALQSNAIAQPRNHIVLLWLLFVGLSSSENGDSPNGWFIVENPT